MEGSVSQFPSPVPAPKVPRKPAISNDKKDLLNVPNKVLVSVTPPASTPSPVINKKPEHAEKESEVTGKKDESKLVTKEPHKAVTKAAEQDKKMVDDLKKDLAKALQSDEELVIRTMKDDLDEVKGRQHHKTVAPHNNQPTNHDETHGRRAVVPRTPLVLGRAPDESDKNEKNNKPTILSSNKLGKNGKVVLAPPKRRKKHFHARTFLWLILLIGVIGVGAWWWINSPDLSSIIPGVSNVGQTMAKEVLPSNYALIVGYHINTEQDRGSLLAAWNNLGAETISMTELMKGDPRLLLNAANIDEFYFVLLEDETRPYLIVPVSQATTDLLVDTPDAETTKVQGWYVSHSMSVSSYLSVLQTGNLASLSESPSEIGATQSPMEIMVGPQAAITLREQLLGSKLANGLLQEATLKGRSIVQGSAIELSGQGRLLQAPQQTSLQSPQAQQNLLSVVPGNASFVRLGSNFSADLDAWSRVVGIIDTQFLEQPAVAALLHQLKTPYAYYQVSTGVGDNDFGTIVSLPPLLAGSLTIPDETIEKGLSSLLTLLTGRKGVAPIEFSNNIYSNIPLRYANFSQPTQALDYALTSQYLVIASSKMAMFTLLDTIAGTGTSIETSTKWGGLLSNWGAVPQGSDIILGQTGLSTMAGLLPTSTNGQVLIGLTLSPGAEVATRVSIKGVLMVAKSGTTRNTISNTR